TGCWSQRRRCTGSCTPRRRARRRPERPPAPGSRPARAMLRYLLERLAALPPVLFGVSVLTFGLMSLVPGHPPEALLRRDGAEPSPQAVQALRRELGLDAPVPVRYARWLAGVLRGDLGRSFRTRTPVVRELGQRFPATLQLGLAAMAVAVGVAVP